MSDDRATFVHESDFTAATPTGGLGLGRLESQYESLFAEALEDGEISAEERQRLDQAAQNLGLDEGRLSRLEEAMTAAYETHHRVRVVDKTKPTSSSLAPLEAPRASDASVEELLEENARLRERVAFLESELERARATENVEVDLGELETHAEAHITEPAEIWKRIRRDPRNVEAYRALRDAHVARGERDGAFLASQALVALGHGSPGDSALVERHRTHSLITPRASIDPTTWEDCLFHPEEDRITGAIFSVIAPAVLVGRVTTLRRDGLLHAPAPELRQDVAASTVMAARAVGWAAALLGLPTPAVFLEKDRDAEFVLNPAMPPSTSIGKRALSGRTAPQLAFLVGRHLASYRGEHFIRALFPAVEDLEDLFLAALLLANSSLPLTGILRARVEPLARAIAPLLEPLQLDALRGYYLRFAEEGGRTNLQRWSQAVEKTTQRVGFALSQDLLACLEILAAAEGPEGPLQLDLLAFSTSERFLLLRRRLGTAVAE